jgi:glycosyltransferase involved in cell wall biosynthesis
MKIAMVGLDISPGTFGGVKNYTEILMNNINKNKVKFYYYSLGKSPYSYLGDDKPTHLGFILNLLKKTILFNSFLKKNKIDIVHLNSGLTQISLFREGILSLISKISGCKTLFFIHGWKDDQYKIITNNRFKKLFFKNILKKQDKIILLAQQFKDKIINLEIDSERIFVSSTMVETKKYQPEKKFFSKPFKILFCATMIKEKGPFELLESIPLLKKKFSDINFIFIGYGNELEKLKLKSKLLKIEDIVTFTGYISLNEKIKMFKEAHIFAFPTYHGEGFPTVILEAMAAGLTLVTTANAGLIDVIENGREGFLLKTMPSKPEDIADNISRLLENPDLMRTISEYNMIKAQKIYDAKVVSNKIVDIYHDL